MPGYTPRENVKVYDEQGNELFECDEYTARSILSQRAGEFIRDADGPKIRARTRELWDGPEQGLGWMVARHWPSPFAVIAAQERRRLLASCFAHLPRQNRTVIQLRYRRGLLFRQIALALDVTEEAVVQMHQRTLAALRDRLADSGVKKLNHIL